MDTTPIERSLRSAETGTVVVDGRLVARVIKRHRRIVGIGLQVPHASCYAIRRDELRKLVPAEELGEAGKSLPEEVVLLPRPKGSEVLDASPAEVLTRLWRGAFHGRVHLVMEGLRRRGVLDGAAIRARIDRIGQTEFDEVRRVLKADDLLLPPHDDAEVYTEFAALLLEQNHFAPRLIGRTFPTLRDPARALAVIAEDVDSRAELAACRPEGATDPVEKPGGGKDSTTPTYSALPAFDVVPAFLSRRATSVAGAQKLVAAAARARAEGNHVRSALSCLAALPAAGEDQQVKLRALVRSDLDALGARLDAALVGPGESASDAARVPWTSSLLPLAVTASERQALRYPVEARLLYDLQRACVAHERGASAVDLVTWALSLGERPIVRKLPATRALKVARHLRTALQKLRHVEMPSADRRLIARLLRMAVRRAEDNVRKTLRPVIEGTLDGVGLKPASVPERVARKKLVEELCDQVVARGFLSIGQLRDALSRSQLKMGDVSVPELVRGDPLILADRALDVSLDGVYRRGEVYLRLLQKVSSVFFGTKLGRLFTLFVILPAGGAFVLLEGVAHMIAPVAKALGAGPLHIVSLASMVVTSLVIFGLIHSEALRGGAMRLLSMLGHALAAVFVRLPRWVLLLGPVRRMLESGLARALARYVLMPLVVATILYVATPLRDVGGVIGPLGAAGVFVAASFLLNTRAGLVAQEVVLDQVALGWEALKARALPGLVRLVMGIFRAMLEVSERTLYRVDEFLRFREGDRRATIPLKAALGLVWFFVAYVIRLYITLLIEPEINPVKHFPVVTVAHKICIPLYPPILSVLGRVLSPLGPVIGGTIAGTTVFLFPSVFGFLVWEFKENFRLYRENRAKNLAPVPIGHHGETVGTLMRPGFHSGTLPKLHGKLRRAAYRADLDASRGLERSHGSLRGLQETLDDLRETVRRAVDREVSGLLAACPRFRAGAITVQSVELGSNRLRLELACEALTKAPTVIAFEEQSGLVVASVTEPGFLDALSASDRVLFENAIAGFYRMAGVDLVREQIRAALGDDVPYDVADEGLVLWPDEGYRTEVIYALDAGFRGPVVPPVVRGEPPLAVPKPLDLRKVLFRDQHIPWAEWALSWREEVPAGEAPRRVLFGASILPPQPSGRERSARASA